MHGIVLFLLVAIVVYLGVNVFLYVQTSPLFVLPKIGGWVRCIFIALAFSFIMVWFIGKIAGVGLTCLVERIGSMWLAAMLYLSMFFVLILLLRLANGWLGFSKYLNFGQNAGYHRAFVIAAYALTAIVLLIGHINATNVKLVRLNVEVDKPLSEHLRVVAVSDIHLGGIIGNKRLQKLVDIVNAQNPDVVLLVGDTFDGDIAPVLKSNVCALFSGISSRYGIFAVTGNHDYMGDYMKKIECLRNSGITLLCDSVVQVSNVYIVGRNDRQSEHALSIRRRPLAELVQPLDSNRVIILLDHQPYALEEAQQCGVDLQLSGHTHNGQMWPFSLVIDSMYELGHGFMQKGKTRYYVSSGYGTWGPRVRIGSRAEVVVVDIKR